MAREARKLLAEAAAKELKGEEGVKLLKAFRYEAKAAEGDGGDVWVGPSPFSGDKHSCRLHSNFGDLLQVSGLIGPSPSSCGTHLLQYP